jgi:hypothetical protein
MFFFQVLNCRHSAAGGLPEHERTVREANQKAVPEIVKPLVFPFFPPGVFGDFAFYWLIGLSFEVRMPGPGGMIQFPD